MANLADSAFVGGYTVDDKDKSTMQYYNDRYHIFIFCYFCCNVSEEQAGDNERARFLCNRVRTGAEAVSV